MDSAGIGSYWWPFDSQFAAMAKFEVTNISKTDANFNDIIGMYIPGTVSG